MFPFWKNCFPCQITSEEVLRALKQQGFKHVTMQVGNGSLESIDKAKDRNDPNLPSISHFRLKDSIAEDIASADLVISHAGSGSVLDCLGAGKKLLVVINDELMDNHQVELAEKLEEEGYLHYCFVSEIMVSLANMGWDSIKPFRKGETKKFVTYLEERLGFIGS